MAPRDRLISISGLVTKKDRPETSKECGPVCGGQTGAGRSSVRLT